MTHPHFSTGQPCNCGFTKHLQQPWKLAETSPKPYEAKMYHGRPHTKGIMGPVRTPFWTTSHEPEAEGFTGATGSVHPVQVRFKNPAHYLAGATWHPGALDESLANGNDGVVVHWAADDRDPSDTYPKRTWAIGLDAGTIVPGHLKDTPYE